MCGCFFGGGGGSSTAIQLWTFAVQIAVTPKRAFCLLPCMLLPSSRHVTGLGPVAACMLAVENIGWR